MKLWVVGKVLSPRGAVVREWEFVGVFDSEERAVAVCRDEYYFVGSVELNYIAPEDITEHWPKGYYPLLEKKKK